MTRLVERFGMKRLACCVVVVLSAGQVEAAIVMYDQFSIPVEHLLKFRTDKSGTEGFGPHDFGSTLKVRPGNHFSDLVTISSPATSSPTNIVWGHFDGPDGGVGSWPSRLTPLRLDFTNAVSDVGFRNRGIQPGINVRYFDASQNLLGEVLGSPSSFVGVRSTIPIKYLVIQENPPTPSGGQFQVLSYITALEFTTADPEHVFSELLIDSPPVTLNIPGDVEIVAGAEVDVTPSYSQTSATVETILAVTHTGTLTGTFANEGEHLRDGIFVDTITYNPNDITVDILQAAAGDLNGDRQVDSTDIQLILASLSFNNLTDGPYTWLQGDFTGDGFVGSIDIQTIVATNLFNTGPYTALPAGVSAVPEPSSLMLVALALLTLLAHGHHRRRA